MVYRTPTRSQELYDIPIRSDELYHFGILGMHWGIRRFQPYSTTGPRKGGKTGKEIGLAAKAGKRRASRESPMETYRKRKAAKAAAKAAEARAREERIHEEFEGGKEKILRSANPDTIAKYQFNMTDKEFKDAIDRIKNRNSLEQLRAANKKTLKKRLGDINDVLDGMFKVASTSLKVKNALKKIVGNGSNPDAPVSEKDLSNLKKAYADAVNEAMKEDASTKSSGGASHDNDLNETREAVDDLYELIGANTQYALPYKRGR